MFVSGFTIIRNAQQYDYPVVESLRSLLPLVDELVVLVGRSEDDTEGLIASIGDPKIKIHHSVWDDSLREGGRVLAVETDKALALIDPRADWAFYLQADEVIHEQYYPVIRAAMERYRKESSVEGLLFHYTHFYGSYDYVGASRRWYRHEIRVVRPHVELHAYRDAQGFRIADRKLKVAAIPAHIYHYGWVKHPALQQAKQRSFHKMWHDDQWLAENIAQVDQFDYSQVDVLHHFKGSHPQVMHARIKAQNWQFSFDPTKARWTPKAKFLYWLEQKTGWRPFEYQNYQCVTRYSASS